MTGLGSSGRRRRCGARLRSEVSRLSLPRLCWSASVDNGAMSLTIEDIRRVPKVLLHDHLDGGLRPQTIVELASRHGYRKLPADDAAGLAEWMAAAAQRGKLELYLEAFQHTVAVMQTRDAPIRVAAECAEDL